MFDKGTRILVVDDMSTMRKLITQSLKDLGFTSIVDAGDGDEAWIKIQDAQIAKKEFQLVISDWNMPRMKGIDLLHRVRGLPQLAGTVFILLTAEAERDQVTIAVTSGVDGYLLKPFTLDQLQNTLNAVYKKVRKAA